MQTPPTWSCEALDKWLPIMHHDIPRMHILLQISPRSTQINTQSMLILGGKSTVNVERINNLHGSAPGPHRSRGRGQINSQCREDQQSMQISPGSTQMSPRSMQILGGWIDSWHKEDQQSVQISPGSVQISPRSVQISPRSVWILGGQGVDQKSTWRGSTVKFYMDNSRDLTYVSCMLDLNLFYNTLFQLKAVH